ncbi:MULTISPECIES: methyltransferase domain-containing protein [unclassified Streptomyces]|uniref:methyltransferase domain-containing protein n=1 Tax=Streptomyces sp. NPDC127532 TaxID=3345399 RepID=UPI00362ABA83
MTGISEREAGPRGLASALVEKGALTTDWSAAFDAVPRHLFLPEVIWPGRAGMNRQDDRVIRSEEPEVWWSAVYRDAPITTQWDDGAYTGPGKGKVPSSSSSMPTMVFSMLDALNVEHGQRVLEIGTGTGWNAALLSHRVGAENVVTVEVDEDSARDARARLEARRPVGADVRRGSGGPARCDRGRKRNRPVPRVVGVHAAAGSAHRP